MSQEPTATPPVSVLLTQVESAQALAATLAINKISAVVVPSPIGAYAVSANASKEGAEEMAKAFTLFVKAVPAILVRNEQGRMLANQWEAGAVTGKLPAALVMDGAPHELEDVLFGVVDPSDVEGAIDTSKIGRFKAITMLRKVTKQQKKIAQARAAREASEA